MDKQTGPKGFLVVLPGEIIEIPQDSDKSWLTLFYSLPRELAEKWKPAYELPRCPYEVLWTDKYNHIVCDDMFKLLVWDCYAWCAWQFFQVKDRKGNYRDIPGSWNQYAGYFPLWRLSYSIIPYIRMKFEQNGLGFQNLYNIPQGVEVPWLSYQQFGNLVGNVCRLQYSRHRQRQSARPYSSHHAPNGRTGQVASEIQKGICAGRKRRENPPVQRQIQNPQG